jgi:hypothetical protein
MSIIRLIHIQIDPSETEKAIQVCSRRPLQRIKTHSARLNSGEAPL